MVRPMAQRGKREGEGSLRPLGACLAAWDRAFVSGPAQGPRHNVVDGLLSIGGGLRDVAAAIRELRQGLYVTSHVPESVYVPFGGEKSR